MAWLESVNLIVYFLQNSQCCLIQRIINYQWLKSMEGFSWILQYRCTKSLSSGLRNYFIEKICIYIVSGLFARFALVLLKWLCLLWQMFSGKINVECFISKMQQSNLLAWEVLWKNWDNTTIINTVVFINYPAVRSDSPARVLAACLGERRGREGMSVWERGWIMNTLN